MSPTSNPFTQMMVAFAPQRFYGRRYEVALILQGVSSREPRSFALYGARIIGKTALLKYLCDPDGAIAAPDAALVDYGPGRSGTLKFLYVDCYYIEQDALLATLYERLLSISEFQRAADPGIASECRVAEALPKIKDDLVNAFRALQSQNVRLTVCLDHFDKTFQSMRYEDDAFLRHLTSYHAFVTATEKSLPEFKREMRVTSPLLNILMPRNVGLLPDTEARALIQTPTEDAGVPCTASDVDFVLNAAGRHPRLLTVVCEYLLNQRREHPDLEDLGPTDVQTRQRMHARLLEQPTIKEFMLYHWDRLSEPEKQTLAKIAAGRAIEPGTDQATLRALRERALIYEDLRQDRYVLFSQLLRDFVLGQHKGGPQDLLEELTPRDRRLFEYLIDRPNQVCTFEELKTEVWENPETTKRSLESAIHRLRRELGKPKGQNWGEIKNVRGKGYRYTPRD